MPWDVGIQVFPGPDKDPDDSLQDEAHKAQGPVVFNLAASRSIYTIPKKHTLSPDSILICCRIPSSDNMPDPQVLDKPHG